MPRIKINKITFGYNEAMIFKDFSIDIHPKNEEGWVVGILGESGIGKSTLLDLILKNTFPLSGNVITNPNEIVISYQPQEHVLLEHLSIKENIEYLLNLSSYKHKGDEKHLNKLIKTLSIDSLINSTTSVSNLSGGEKQRVMLARAMSIKPDVLILDEPTKGLDSLRKHALLIELRQIANDFNCLIIMATHNILDVRGVADEIIYLYKEDNRVKSIQKKIGVGNNEQEIFLDVINSSYPYLSIIKYSPLVQKNIQCNEILNNGDLILIDSDKIILTKNGEIPINISFMNQHCIHLRALDFKLIIPYRDNVNSFNSMRYNGSAFLMKDNGTFKKISIIIE